MFEEFIIVNGERQPTSHGVTNDVDTLFTIESRKVPSDGIRKWKIWLRNKGGYRAIKFSAS